MQASLAAKSLAAAMAVVTILLSINPVRNMISSRQIMNTSFNAWHLVGAYGAFGSVTRARYEVAVEGTADSVLSPKTQWLEYEFKGKPGALNRMPAQIAPYHLRLDWLMWFAAMGSYRDQPWFLPFVVKLLENDAPTLSLLASNPFEGHAPRYIRAELYRYEFTSPEERRKTGNWWRRERAGQWLPPVSRDMLSRSNQ